MPPRVAKKQPPRDRFGRQVPADKLAAWNRQDEVRDRIKQLQESRSVLQRAFTEGDPLYAGLDSTRIQAHLRQAEAALAEVDVYCVCPMCQGMGCKICANRGLISKWRYDAFVPRGFKA